MERGRSHLKNGNASGPLNHSLGSSSGSIDGATIIKFHTKAPKISYLYYPDFDSDAHPALHSSVKIDLQDLKVRLYDYSTSANPPILHRKETFVSNDYPQYDLFCALTKSEEEFGLLDNPTQIGTRNGWIHALDSVGVTIENHSILIRNSYS